MAGVVQVVTCIREVLAPAAASTRVRFGSDLRGEDVFTFFEALEPNVVTAATGACSLNCGGTCEFCTALV